MFLKPKTSVQNEHALLYKRFSQTEESSKGETNLLDILENGKYIQSGVIGKYQINKYYYYDNFDYMIKGSISKGEIQPVKGLIVPATSFEIRTFDDVELDHDDLVVVDGALYSIESIEEVQKRVPKKFSIYFATLNRIL
jgi:hypothetical protein